MTLTNAIKKLEKSGYKVEQWKTNKGIFSATKENNNHYIDIYQNGNSDDVAVIDLRTKGSEDDPMSDYHAGTFCRNITQAIRLADNLN